LVLVRGARDRWLPRLRLERPGRCWRRGRFRPPPPRPPRRVPPQVRSPRQVPPQMRPLPAVPVPVPGVPSVAARECGTSRPAAPVPGSPCRCAPRRPARNQEAGARTHGSARRNPGSRADEASSSGLGAEGLVTERGRGLLEFGTRARRGCSTCGCGRETETCCSGLARADLPL
jgi:hypothetical protein